MSDREFTIAGRAFKLTRPANYWQAVTEHIRNSRVDPIATAISVSGRTPRDAVAGLFAGAFDAARRRGVVTFQDVSEFEQTPDGLAFRFLLAASLHHGTEFNHFDAACRFVHSLGDDDLSVLTSALAEIGR